MSAIAGVVGFNGLPPRTAAQYVWAMTAAMAHHGPDGITHWDGGDVALAHCLLRTTPESFEEAQPRVTADARFVQVFAGRLDNAEEVRHALVGQGRRLQGRSWPARC